MLKVAGVRAADSRNNEDWPPRRDRGLFGSGELRGVTIRISHRRGDDLRRGDADGQRNREVGVTSIGRHIREAEEGLPLAETRRIGGGVREELDAIRAVARVERAMD